MPYCTIEEAWSQNLNHDLKQDQFKGNELHQDKYSEIELPDSEIYNNEQKEIRCRKKNKELKKRLPNMSRTYDRLSEHSGAKTRHVNRDNRRLVMKKSPELDSSDNHPNYANSDMPINPYNNDMYEKLVDDIDSFSVNNDKSIMDDNTEEEDNVSLEQEYQNRGMVNENQSMMEDFKDMTYVDNSKLSEISKLKSENIRLKKIISELKLNKYDDKDSILDLIVYIFSGIMVILIMENITKLSRKL